MSGIGSWFRTDYDEPATAARIPVQLSGGGDRSIALLDQTVRGEAIVGRIVGDFGAVGIRVRPDGRPVRATVAIGLDDIGTSWWSDRVPRTRSAAERPRLITVRAQGRLCGAVLLSRRQGLRRAGPVTASLSFDVDEADLAADGLFLVEFGAAPPIDWATGALSPSAAIGVRIDRIELHERLDRAPTAGPAGFTGCDFAVVQPGAPIRFRLDTAVVRQAPPVPRTLRGQFAGSRPARAAAKVVRAARRVAVCALPRIVGPAPDLRATDLSTGASVPVEVISRDGHTEVRLARQPVGPVLLGAARPRPTRSWHLDPVGDR